MNESQIIQMTIQGGAVGLCALVLIIGWRKDKMVNKTVNNHLSHLYESQKADTDAKIQLAEAITKFADKIGKCPLK